MAGDTGIDVRILAPGIQAEPYEGVSLRVRPVNFEDANPTIRVAGIDATVTVSHPWRASPRAYDRVEVLVQGLFDLVMQWQSPASEVRVARPDRRRAGAIPLDQLAPYELGTILGGGVPFPNTVMRVSRAMVERVDALVGGAFALPRDELESLVPPLGQVAAAAVAQRPIDRVTPLWAALELLAGRGYRAVNAALLPDATTARQEAQRLAAWRVLSRLRGRFARDLWFDERHRIRLAEVPGTNLQRMHMATAVAFLSRSAVAHGHWPLGGSRHRLECLVAEEWMWNLIELGVEKRVARERLAKVTPAMAWRTTAGAA